MAGHKSSGSCKPLPMAHDHSAEQGGRGVTGTEQPSSPVTAPAKHSPHCVHCLACHAPTPAHVVPSALLTAATGPTLQLDTSCPCTALCASAASSWHHTPHRHNSPYMHTVVLHPQHTHQLHVPGHSVCSCKPADPLPLADGSHAAAPATVATRHSVHGRPGCVAPSLSLSLNPQFIEAARAMAVLWQGTHDIPNPFHNMQQSCC